MTDDEYFDAHIPHRVNLLIAFRQRYSGRNPKTTLDREAYRDLFRCAKDISILMVRFFCDEMGIRLPRGQSDVEERKGTPPFGISKLNVATIKSDPIYADLCEVLRAANRAVAHIEPGDVDHPFRTPADEERIFRVIDWVEGLVRINIYQTAGRDFGYSMALKNNVM